MSDDPKGDDVRKHDWHFAVLFIVLAITLVAAVVDMRAQANLGPVTFDVPPDLSCYETVVELEREITARDAAIVFLLNELDRCSQLMHQACYKGGR